MSPITDDEQVDELKERRRARESRPGLKRAALRQQVRISDPVSLEQADVPSQRAHAA